jgi:hypothetical protein
MRLTPIGSEILVGRCCSGATIPARIFADINVRLTGSAVTLHNNSPRAASGGGIFVGSQGKAGTMTNMVFADNNGSDIVEQCPAPGAAP